MRQEPRNWTRNEEVMQVAVMVPSTTIYGHNVTESMKVVVVVNVVTWNLDIAM